MRSKELPLLRLPYFGRACSWLFLANAFALIALSLTAACLERFLAKRLCMNGDVERRTMTCQACHDLPGAEYDKRIGPLAISTYNTAKAIQTDDRQTKRWC